MTEEYGKYMSVSEYAERVGKTSQTIRNWIKRGRLETVTFRRGRMNGILVKAIGNENETRVEE